MRETTARLWLIEPRGSPFEAPIAQAARELQLSIERVDRPTRPPDGVLVAVGPSSDAPLQIVRELRQLGSRGPCILFAASEAQRDSLQAELLRDPFVCDRYELIQITDDRRQLASRIRQAGARVERTHRQGAPPKRIAPRTVRPRRPVTDQFLATVLAQAGEAIISTDSQGNIATWNNAAERLFGLSHDAAVGQPLRIVDATTPELSSVAETVLRDAMSTRVSVKCHRGNADPIELTVSLAPIHDGQRRPLGLSIVARDDTAHKQAEEALRDANRQKDEFLAIMSHELRTPLTSILGYTDMLLRGLGGPLSERSGRYVGNVRSAGDRLLELVNGLLDFTRLEAGAERLELEPVDLRAMVKRAVDRCRPAAEGKQLDLRVSIDGPAGPVQADEDKLQHVLRNYLGNAIKFTPEGGSVNVEIARDPREQSKVRVTVSDSGIGIRNEQLAHVWERFYQGDASLTRPYGGMGLGLSIARHLVHLHGGEVGAESNGPGHGSTFWFSLPLPDAKEQPRTARTAPRRAGTHS